MVLQNPKRKKTVTITLDSDIAEFFQTSEDINSILRQLINQDYNTLILKREKSKKWYPVSISSLEDYLSQFIVPLDSSSEKECRGLKKNMAYSLQYLEFLDRCTHILHQRSFRVETGCGV